MIYLFVSLFLDVFLSLFISSSYQNINIFFPCILIGSIPVFYIILKNKKVFLIIVLILGIVYDLLFSDVFLVNIYYFLLYGLFILLFFNVNSVSFFKLVILSILGTCFYDIFIFFILILNDYAMFNINELCYKLKNTFLVNFVYVNISIIVLKSRIFSLKKSKKRYS